MMMAKADATIYEVNVGDEVHSIFETPSNITNLAKGKNASSTFNLIMVDVSGSMWPYWKKLMFYWNECISPLLPDIESSKIFVFGNSVYFVRNGNFFEDKDYFPSKETNLADVIITINKEINYSKENYIRIFLLTVGDHNATDISPDVEIAKLSIPPEKTIEVFLLAFGEEFPVEFSITIRSALHNGNANVPSIFWARWEDINHDFIFLSNTLDRIQSITEIVKQGNVNFKIQPVGKLAPGFHDVDIAHFGEFIYYATSPDTLSLNLHTEEGDPINLNITLQKVDLRFLLDRVFRQWISVIIQHHRKKLQVPHTAFEVMDSIYAFLHKKLLEELENASDCSIKKRLGKINVKFLETEFSNLMNQSKTIIGLEGKYSTEIELAVNILKTTVMSKHDIKNLNMKYHEIFDIDLRMFIKKFEDIKVRIYALPEPSPDDCCRVTMTSMVKDLQDPSLKDLFKEDKYTFMKNFTVTGIPVYAPVKSFSQKNPWTLCIVNILKSPFTIVSQSTLELSVKFGCDLPDDKEIYLQEGEEDSKFNVIVPVFEPGIALALKPLIRTNIFSRLSTFCILKNHHFKDRIAHIAALGCTWMKLITDNAGNKKPKYVTQTLSLVEATADLFTDRSDIARYINVLLSEPQKALMTKSSKLYVGEDLNCESLIKPMFLLYLVREKKAVSEILPKMIPLIILEFIGRCLTNFQTESNAHCIYSLLFAPNLSTVEKRESFFKNKCEDICRQVLKSYKKPIEELLETCFYLDELEKILREHCRKFLNSSDVTEMDIKVNLNLIKSWKNEASAGNILLSSIKAFASEFQLSEDIIQSLFDEKLMFVYVYHCLQNKSSKDRLTNPLPMYEEALESVRKNIAKENEVIFELIAESKRKMAIAYATIYEVNVGDEVHSILQTPSNIFYIFEREYASSTFNLVMVDVSKSMQDFWKPLMKYWNEYISPLLQDSEFSKIFVFGNSVHFVRNGNFLENEDFRMEETNLTDAIKTINEEIYLAKESYIRLFLVTDGCHNATEITPDVEIAKLSIPPEKTIEVFLLAFGRAFPVEYSITIRSALHNGNANVPSIFWAKCEDFDYSKDTLNEIQSIAEIVNQGHLKFEIQPVGKLAPGFLDVDRAHFGEFIYYATSPDLLFPSLHREDFFIELNITVKKVELRFLLDSVFRQWNSIIVQQHRKMLEVPHTAFNVMDSIYAFLHKHLLEQLENASDCSLEKRLAKKNFKFLETEFSTLINQSKIIIGLGGKYSTEMELAEHILRTTVKSKHEYKNLKMNGYGREDYKNDLREFVKVFEIIKESIFALPEPSPDDCCRVTMTSMVKDLQDPSLTDLFKEDKFTFMKNFTVTGIPVFAPVKSFSQINPWTLCIVNILKNPFKIVSQITLELSAEFGGELSDEIYIQEGEEDSKFNVIIPVFESAIALALKPLIRTNIFAMLSTFCILKNPHIIDHNAHIAALGCTWMKLITDNVGNKKSEYVTQTLSLVEATADLYTDRGDIARYIDALLSKPQEALMTQSSKLYGENNLKCESLIKPMFFLYLVREKKYLREKIQKAIPLIILEFTGRCLSNFLTDSNAHYIYGLLFVPDLRTFEKWESFFDIKCKEACNQVLKNFKNSYENLLKCFFKPEDLQKNLKAFCRNHFQGNKITELDIDVNLELIEHWKNAASVGNIRLASIKAFASECQLSEGFIQSSFDERLMFVYVYHCLRNKTSKRRLTNPLPTYEEALINVKKKVGKEIRIFYESTVMKMALDEATSKWKEEYHLVHSNKVVVEPMKKKEILQLAIENGVDVSEESFNNVYRYNTTSGLLRNACMVKKCPFYLIPNRTFNQHISIERTKDYVHQLHKISRETASKDLNGDDVIKTIMEEYQSQNRLTVPEPPSDDSLQSLNNKINVLLVHYKNKFLD